MSKRITIDPLTRLEGHGKVEIFLDEDGEVANAYLIVPELRGFERLCVGRPVEEMPRITARICGLCPQAHHVASAKALDAVYGVEPTETAKMIRELFYMAFFVLDHATHFFVLAAPDFLLRGKTPVSERNVFQVVRELGPELGRRVIDTRMRNNHVLKLLGGRSIHPVAALPGGWSLAVSEEMRREIEDAATANVDFALSCLRLYEESVLGSKENVALMVADQYTDRTFSMGTVDDANRPNFYEGDIRVVDPEGEEFARYDAPHYLEHIAEHVESWTYMKFPYLADVGWKGLQDGGDSGVYTTTPLSRLNVADAMATPRAQEEYEKMFETLGAAGSAGGYLPIHYRLATHWARLIELLYASERMLELAKDQEITNPDVRNPIDKIPREGIGCVEAPRGTLTHHYWTDEKGIVTRVNLVVGTTNNHAAMAMSIKKAASSLIGKGTEITDELLNRIEMAIRAYDPCLSCATHSLPGRMPLQVVLRDSYGAAIQTLLRKGDASL
ncbi:MAG: Ni/Fe hydrogenase subunit alpha [bacterium]|nr:Ni/Fe hydrogenase subunit alpha [bacterium]